MPQLEVSKEGKKIEFRLKYLFGRGFICCSKEMLQVLQVQGP